MKKVSIIDVAKHAGVSVSTVSLVLRNSPLVHTDTRARVEAELKRQRYVYNRGAANLRRRTSSSIALVINDLANPFFAEFAAGVDEALGEKGYVTLLGSTGESPERQQAVLASLMEHTPAGVILSPAEGSDAAQLHKVLDARANVLLFNRELAGADDWGFLGLDNQHGAQLATEHLIALGHRRIAFYGGHADSSSCRQRRAGQIAQGATGPLEPQGVHKVAGTRGERRKRVIVVRQRQLHAIAAGQIADGQLGHAVVQRFGVKGVVSRGGIEEGFEVDGVAVGPGR